MPEGEIMSVVDNFLNFMKLDPSPEPDMETGYLPEVDEEEEQPRRRGRDRSYSDEDEDEDPRRSRKATRDSRDSARYDDSREDDRPAAGKSIWPGRKDDRTPERRPAPEPIGKERRSMTLAEAGTEVRVFKPTNLDEARRVTDTLLGGQSAVLNLEGLDIMMAQRIIDFVGGSNYAIKGHFTRISNFIFLFTPKDVDIAGDVSSEPSQNMADNASSNINMPGEQ